MDTVFLGSSKCNDNEGDDLTVTLQLLFGGPLFRSYAKLLYLELFLFFVSSIVCLDHFLSLKDVVHLPSNRRQHRLATLLEIVNTHICSSEFLKFICLVSSVFYIAVVLKNIVKTVKLSG